MELARHNLERELLILNENGNPYLFWFPVQCHRHGISQLHVVLLHNGCSPAHVMYIKVYDMGHTDIELHCLFPSLSARSTQLHCIGQVGMAIMM